MPDQIDHWKFLLVYQIVYCFNNGRRFLLVPDQGDISYQLH